MSLWYALPLRCIFVFGKGDVWLIAGGGRIDTGRALGGPRLDRPRAAERSNAKDEETRHQICGITELSSDVSMEFGFLL